MIASVHGWIGTRLAASEDWLVLPAATFLLLLILVPLTLLALFLALDFVLAGGCLMTFALPGVASAVQYHLPLASAQAWPSLAVPYTPLAEILLPNGSSNLTWLPLLLRLNPVILE